MLDLEILEWDLVMLKSVHKNHEKDIWECKVCDYNNKRKDYCLSHMETEHKPPGFKGYKCIYCPSTLNCRNTIKRHIRDHHSDPSTSLVFKEPAELLSGNLYKTNEGWQCKLCSYKNVRKDCSLNHIESLHPPSSYKSYLCEECEYTGKTRNALRAHIGREHRGKSTSFFDKTAGDSIKLDTKHVNKIVGYKCDACEYIGNTWDSLKNHTRSEHADKMPAKRRVIPIYKRNKENRVDHTKSVPSCKNGDEIQKQYSHIQHSFLENSSMVETFQIPVYLQKG